MSHELCTRQVSIFLENKGARLADVCDLLGRSTVNIRAFTTAETPDWGIFRLIVSDPDLALKTLREHGLAVSECDVLVVQLKDQPGGLAKVLMVLRDARIHIDYMYAFVTPREGEAVVILRVVDEVTEPAIAALQQAKIEIVDPAEVYSL
jgi:hypothetical protein